ncbi:TetR/AcrR family transcriptional regulator [Enterococcus raffinosus]|uniref:TetR/AcrR family transcriptional regulator n=1 Tax=Enterococcus raffinosus TaxID=71452 RepID=UPI001C129085|nr:TetR/AcrR family transcriptional regulator [Enterococcus raffinosus]MBU5363482.1 TetR/AcrR family transcriptional regulator [Enterococcus raffinosus]
MKYNLAGRKTRNALRVLGAFSQAILDLLTKQSFETITVNMLCEKADYPRSTFYNYFDDKYDLLNYCWTILSDKVKLEEAAQFDKENVLIIYFDRLYDLMKEHDDLIAKVLIHNHSNGYLYISFNEFLRKASQQIFATIFATTDSIPVELIVEHCSSTVTMVIDWIFIKRNMVDKKVAHQYLSVIFGNTDLAAGSE